MCVPSHCAATWRATHVVARTSAASLFMVNTLPLGGWTVCICPFVRRWVCGCSHFGSSAAVSMVCVCSQESLRAVPSGMCRRQVSIVHKTLHPVHFRVS